VPLSSLHSLLRVLQARDYVVRLPEHRRYCLGPRLPEVSRGYLDPQEPFATARRVMHQVAERCGETVHLAILTGRDAVYIAAAPSRYPLSVASHEGMRLPAHATAAGKALLARLPDEQLAGLYAGADWPRLTPRTPDSFAALCRELAEARWMGYARDLEEAETGLQCLAAVLPDEPGRPAVAVSISAPAARLQGDGFWRLVHALREVTAYRDPARRPPRGRPLVGWSLSRTKNPVYVEMREAATAAMTRLGGELLWADAPDEHKQATDVLRLLEEPLDALIVHPTNAVAAAPLFTQARARDLLLVCYHRPARTRDFDFYAGGDTYQRGCLQAHALAGALGARGGVFIVEGGSYDDNARSIAQGNRDTLARYPGVEVLGSQPCEHWLRAAATAAVLEALQTYGTPRLRGIIAANDDMAIGIAALLAERGLIDRIALVGGDGDQRALDLLRSGRLLGTAFQDSAALAVTTLHYVAGVLDGTASVAALPLASIFHAPEGPPVRVLDVPYTWIDRSNLELLECYWAERAAYRLPSAPLAGSVS
jgi:DNA-binding IclR family transcriptional regulator/ABC-type xylose transport system substrate-binding protein